MDGPAPRISGILTTYNRAPLLARVFDSLLAQSLPRDQFEIVLVDDGSTDDTRAVVEAYRGRLPLHVIHQENAGLASAKNVGVTQARAPLVVFMDDDDVATPALLAEHLRAHERWPEETVAVLGHTRLEPAIAGDLLMHYVTEVGCFLFSYPGLRDGAQLDYTCFWGGRSSCKRALLQRHGLFDPVFRFGCEDIELGYRLAGHGLKVRYHAAAQTEMIRKVSLEEFLRRLLRQGQSQYRFHRLHPAREVAQWCEIPEWTREWPQLAPHCDDLFASARELDRLLRLRIENDLPPDAGERDLLHGAYRRAFRAAKLRGIDAAARQGAEQARA
jgi:glycosyltransferase involved in cell wall biosynthesis